MIDNEFVLRAKTNYESNVELDDYIGFAYDEATVISMFMSAVNVAITGPDNSVISAYDAWTRAQDMPVTFGRAIPGPGSPYCCIINLYSQVAANRAAEVFSGAYSYCGLNGRANPGQRCVYLITSSLDDYGIMRAMIDKVGYERLATYFGARRMQVYWKEVEGLPPVIRVPSLEGGKELIAKVPDTFSADVSDESKVTVLDLGDISPNGRKLLGTYTCFETQLALAEIAPDLAHGHLQQVKELSTVDHVTVYPTVAYRNLAIFSDLAENGVMVRQSWLQAFDPDPGDVEIIRMFNEAYE
jgi:hypothetical protein